MLIISLLSYNFIFLQIENLIDTNDSNFVQIVVQTFKKSIIKYR